MRRIDIFEELKRVREEAEYHKKKAAEWQEKYYELEKKFKEMEALLNQFLNANTPSSQLPPQFKNKDKSQQDKEKESKPKGKPKGSNGATKEPPQKTDKKLRAKLPSKKCKKCGKKLIFNTYTQLVYEIPEIKMEVIEFTVEEGYCEHCDLLYVGTHPKLPIEGSMGPNLQAFCTELKHNFAGSYPKISSFIEDITGDGLSHTAINDCIHRVANRLELSYKEFEERLSEVDYSHSDETSWPLNGKPWWLWLFVTLNFVFITIENSRARKILTKYFGEHFAGIIISDCLSVYRKFAAAFQKCWAHLLRKTSKEAEKYPKRDIVRMHKELRNMYDDIMTFLSTKPDFSQRVWRSIMYHQKLQRLANHKWNSEQAKNIVNSWLKEYEGQWLVGVIIPEIPLTNNKNERGIRKVIPTRKMCGGHRTKQGARDFAIIETHRQTWKLNGKSSYIELAKKLSNLNAEAVT